MFTQEPRYIPQIPLGLFIFIITCLFVGTVISHSHVAAPEPPPVATHREVRKWTWSDDAISWSGKGVMGEADRTSAVSPDGKHLAVVSGASIWIHDIYGAEAASGLSLLNGEDATVIKSLAYSPDGLILAAGTDYGVVQLWEIKNQRLLHSFVRHEPDCKVDTLAFSPDGGTLASGTRDEIKVWNIETQAHLATLRRHKRRIVSLAFSPDGETLASREVDDTVNLWEIATGKNLAAFKYPRHVFDVYVRATKHFNSAKTAGKGVQKAAIEAVIAEFRDIVTKYANTKYADLSLAQIGEAYMILADEDDEYWNDALDYFDKLWAKYVDGPPVDAQVAKALRFAQSKVAAITSFMESHNIHRRTTGGSE